MPWPPHWLTTWVCGFLAASLGLCSAAPRGDTSFAIASWDIENGLPSSVVRSVAQAKDGYLWIGTEGGLARFDGVRFKIFDSEDTLGLKTRCISTLLIDASGTLWIAGDSGELACFKAGRFYPVPLALGTPIGQITALAEDGAKGLWIAGDSCGLLRLAEGRTSSMTAQAPGAASPAVSDQAGGVWFRSQTDLLRYGLDPRRVVKERSRLAAVQPQVLCPARDGGLWVAAQDRVRKLRDNAWQADFTLYPETGETGRRIVTALLEDHEGGLWIGTYGGGVFYRAQETSPMRVATQGALSQNIITCFCEDSEGSIWVGTDGGGLHRVKRRPLCTLFLPAPFTEHIFQTLCLGHDGSIWAGTDGAGLFRFQRGEFQRFAETDGLPGVHVTSVLEDHRTNLWVGTTRGLFVGNGATFHPADQSNNITDLVLALYEDRAGQLWIGTATGVARICEGRLEVFPSPPAKPDVRAFAQDTAGTLWVATMNSGLNRFLNGELVRQPWAGGASPNIRTLLADPDGAIWIGTFGEGLARLKQGRITVFTVKDGLANGIIHAMVDDGAGRLWLSSDEGIFALKKRELDEYVRGRSKPLSCLRFSVGDGLASRRGSGSGQPVAARSSDGRLWIPNMKALVVLDAAPVHPPVPSPPVLIEEAIIDDQVQRLDWISKLRVSSGRKRFQFHYTSISLASPEAVRFRYRLVGSDPDWVEAGSRRTAYYGQLPPGHYQFQVMASHGEGTWKETQHSLLLQVVPHFWQTGWFITLALIVLAGSVAASVHHVTRKKLKGELASLRLQQAVETERGRIARDIHDDLGASLTQIAQLSELAQSDFDRPEEARRHLDQIFSAAQGLARAVDEIIWATNPRNDTVENFANYVSKFAQDYLRSARISCRLDVPDFLPAWPLPSPVRHHLYLATKETLHNILKHAAATEVWLRIAAEAEVLTLTFEDNGKGFESRTIHPPSAGPLLPDADGLKNLQSRLTQIGGLFEQSSQTGRGTTTKLQVPVKVERLPSLN